MGRALSSGAGSGALLTWSGFEVKLVRAGVELVRVAVELVRVGVEARACPNSNPNQGCSPSEATLPPQALSSPG